MIKKTLAAILFAALLSILAFASPAAAEDDPIDISALPCGSTWANWTCTHDVEDSHYQHSHIVKLAANYGSGWIAAAYIHNENGYYLAVYDHYSNGVQTQARIRYSTSDGTTTQWRSSGKHDELFLISDNPLPSWEIKVCTSNQSGAGCSSWVDSSWP